VQDIVLGVAIEVADDCRRLPIDELVGKPDARGGDLLVGLLLGGAGAQPTVELVDILTTQVVERGGKASMRLKQRRRHEAKMRRPACRRKGASRGRQGGRKKGR